MALALRAGHEKRQRLAGPPPHRRHEEKWRHIGCRQRLGQNRPDKPLWIDLVDPKRLEQALPTVLDRRQGRSERKQHDIADLNKRASETDLRLNRLYDAIKGGVANPNDPELKARIATLKATRDQARTHADRAPALLQTFSQKSITPQMLRNFGSTARDRMRLPGSGHRRDHLAPWRSASTAMQAKSASWDRRGDLLRSLTNTAGPVTSFVPKWRRRCPSNYKSKILKCRNFYLVIEIRTT
jgi:site-specific DNA recombinase